MLRNNKWLNKADNINHLSFIIMIGLVVTLPLFYGGNRPAPASFMTIVASISLFLWSISAYKKKSLSRISLKYIWYIVLPFILVAMWSLVQIYILGGDFVHPIWKSASIALGEPLNSSVVLDSSKALFATTKIFTYGAVFWLAVQLCRDGNNAKTALVAISVCGFVYALYGLIMHALGIDMVLGYKKTMYLGDVSSVFINRNSYATYAGIGFLTSISLFGSKVFSGTSGVKGKYYYRILLGNFNLTAIFYLIASITLFTSIILTSSRAGLFAVIVGLLGLFLFSLITKFGKRNRAVVIASSSILFIIIASLISVGGSEISKRFLVLDKEIELRGDIYKSTINAISDSPYLGVGMGNFEEIFDMYRSGEFAHFESKRVNHAHNTYLEVILELGIPAFCLLFISICAITIICFTGLKKRKRGTIYAQLAIASTAMIWTHALADFSVEMPAIAITYMFILGVGVAQSWSSRDSLSDREENKNPEWYYKTSISMAFIFSSFLLISGTVYFTASLAKLGTEEKLVELKNQLFLQAEEYAEIKDKLSSALYIKKQGEDYMDMAIVNIAMANEDGYFEDSGRKRLFEAKENLVNGLKLAPANSIAWIRLAYVDMLLNGNSKLAADSIYMSMLTAPYSYSNLYFRLGMAMVLWDYFNEEQKATVENQIVAGWYKYRWHLVGVAKTAKAADIIYNALAKKGKDAERFRGMVRQKNKF